jgi:hypothetical protein
VFEDVRFTRAKLRGCDLRGAVFVECDFTGADLKGAKLTRFQEQMVLPTAKQRRAIDWHDDEGPEPDGAHPGYGVEEWGVREGGEPGDPTAITPAALDGVFAALRPGRYDWRALLPETFGTFFGHAVGLVFETRAVARKGLAPRVNRQETDLARTVLAGLPGLLRECERRFAEFAPRARGQIREPQVCVVREELERSTDRPWRLSIRLRDNPDYRYELEFKGPTFVRIWGGD